jgi:hypothetical protein
VWGRQRPVLRQQFVDVAGRPAGCEPAEDILEVGEGIDSVERTGTDDAVESCSALRTGIGPGEEIVAPSQGQAPDLLFAQTMPCPGLCRVGSSMWRMSWDP